MGTFFDCQAQHKDMVASLQVSLLYLVTIPKPKKSVLLVKVTVYLIWLSVALTCERDIK